MTGMKDTLGDTPYELAFDGKTYQPARDYVRLKGQLARVYDFMKSGNWHTIEEISDAANGSQAAVSARLRDLRKSKYGSHEVERRHIGNGLFQYRIANAPRISR